MQIVISMKELKDAVVGLSRVVNGRGSLAVLSAVKINAEKITGTNLSEYISRLVKGSGDGEFIVDFKELKEFLKGSQKTGDVTFDIVDDRVSAHYQYKDKPVEHVFVRLPEKDWPTEPTFIAKPEKISADALEAIMQVIPLTSKDDSRRTLNGVLLEPGAIVASDGKQLVKFHEETGVKSKVILPKTKVLTSGMLSDQDGTIAQNKCYCQIISGPWEYAVKGIAGNYPQYQHVIPKESECSIVISNKDAHYLKSAIPLLESTTEHKAIHLYADNGDVRFLSENLKSMHVKIDAEFTGKDTAVIQMNREPLLQALRFGFNKFSFSPGGVNPILATGRRDDVFVFMSLHGGLPVDQVIKAVHDTYNQPKEEKQEMPKPQEEDTKNDAGLKVVNGETADPFEELFNGVAKLKQQARDMTNLANELQKKTKDAQKSVKQQERDYKSTRDILEKLKNVSGF